MENTDIGIVNAVHDNPGGTKEIWRTFWILLGLTIVELILGYILIGVESHGLRLGLKGAIIILMLAKAFYIVAYFMHLKSEIRNLIMTILVPLALLIWAIIAFLYEGNSYRNNRNTYDPYKRERSHIMSTDVKADEKGKPQEKRTGAME
ncbi:cytochrome C oxidase subunit IV family protein [Segetibacter koreensis]|uniref:cytochrome C oxidase subunit IV family protein n=1 Tax=Segetibacter koreensis TaxID=398037 RepID=UPI0003721F00|nr:cytochrome C oxidase subunit IV family protein [Segetibacter koreensis]